ncbi:MAG: ABC transporter permease [Bacteroidales bacterium]|nr:ABC transporter permease [Bacteroidales bacterium]
MLKPIKQIIRSTLKNRTISFISISGFALASAVILLLVAFISTERSYDKDIPEVENIYRVLANGDNAFIPEDASVLIKEQIPEVKEACNYFVGNKPTVFRDKSYPSKLICTDNSIFNFIGAEVIAGNLDNFHTVPNQVVLIKSFAEKIFKDENPIGQTINLSHKEDVVVVAVIKDLPKNRSLFGDVFCSNKLKVTYSAGGWNDIKIYYDNLLVKLMDNISLGHVEERLKPVINNLYPNDHYRNADAYVLSPFKDAYFAPINYDGLKHANVKLIDLLTWLTLCIFIFAFFNYINFTVARVTSEFKNVGINQVLGASKLNIFQRFISEALIQLVVSLNVAVFLIFLLKPLMEGLLGQEIILDNLLNSVPIMLAITFSILFVAILAGSYPAYVALKSKPVLMLKSKITGLNKRRDLRMPLNIIQFAASIVAVVAFITISQQINFCKNKKLGFDTEQLVRIEVHHKIVEHLPALLDKIGSLPGVKSICPTHGTPWAIYSNSENEEYGRFDQISSNSQFLETFNIKLDEGRNFHENEKAETALINKRGMQQLGWDSFEGKKLFGAEVIGVIDDFNFQDLHSEVGALMIRNSNDLSHLNVRLYPGDISGTMKQIESIFSEIAGNFNYEYRFYDEWIDSMYKKEENQARSIQFVSILAMLLASFGMFGLASYSLKRRIKEIGIRKVNGARISEVMIMLNKDFVKWVAIAFIIATPIAYFAMNKWLENFAYKTTLSWWIFALAGMLALGIVLLTVSWQSWKTATRNPVEALRYE